MSIFEGMTRFEGFSVALAAAALAPIVPMARFIDKRYARMSDVVELQNDFADLKSMLHTKIIDDYETDVESMDDQISVLAAQESRTEIEEVSLGRKRSRRDQYLRKLERIKA